MGQWTAWQDDFAVGVERIDEQHRELFRQFNVLGDAVWDGKDKEHIAELLHFLVDSIVKHFGDEEKLMHPEDYPDYEAHLQAHRDHVQELSDFVRMSDAGEVQFSLVISIVIRLGEWTRDHIRGMDKALFLHAKSIQNA